MPSCAGARWISTSRAGPSHVVLSTFLDQGRVWDDGPRLDEVLSDLHRGWGGGVRVGMGDVVALDAGTSRRGGLPIYIGLGYLY
jgi:outer membrane translocation and assembly module TamA